MLKTDKMLVRVLYLVFWFLWIIGIISLAFMLPAVLAGWLAHLTGIDRQVLSVGLFFVVIGAYGLIGRQRIAAPAQFVIDRAEAWIARDARKQKPTSKT